MVEQKVNNHQAPKQLAYDEHKGHKYVVIKGLEM